VSTGYIGEALLEFPNSQEGNTEGRPSMDETTRAYIAGFLDGDGSIFFQLVRRSGYVYGYQIRASICFYQNTKNKDGLLWLKEQLGSGYLRDRAGSMSDYAIVGYREVRRILLLVRPYVVFKKQQVEQALVLLDALKPKYTPQEFLATAQMVDSFSTLNYSKKKHINAASVEDFLKSMGFLVPVTTEAFDAEIDVTVTTGGNSNTPIIRQLLETG